VDGLCFIGSAESRVHCTFIKITLLPTHYDVSRPTKSGELFLLADCVSLCRSGRRQDIQARKLKRGEVRLSLLLSRSTTGYRRVGSGSIPPRILELGTTPDGDT
jgi:hypothetical protein